MYALLLVPVREADMKKGVGDEERKGIRDEGQPNTCNFDGFEHSLSLATAATLAMHPLTARTSS